MEDQNRTSSEEMINDLRNSLSYYQNDERRELRQIKAEAFRMAIQIRPQTDYSGRIGQPTCKSYTTEDLIKSANKIYEELIK